MCENPCFVHLKTNSGGFVQKFQVDREECVAFLQQVSQCSLHGGILFLSYQTFVYFKLFLKLWDKFLEQTSAVVVYATAMVDVTNAEFYLCDFSLEL